MPGRSSARRAFIVASMSRSGAPKTMHGATIFPAPKANVAGAVAKAAVPPFISKAVFQSPNGHPRWKIAPFPAIGKLISSFSPDTARPFWPCTSDPAAQRSPCVSQARSPQASSEKSAGSDLAASPFSQDHYLRQRNRVCLPLRTSPLRYPDLLLRSLCAMAKGWNRKCYRSLAPIYPAQNRSGHPHTTPALKPDRRLQQHAPKVS
jgi:hypothetical protein